jgi:hypothetical protein
MKMRMLGLLIGTVLAVAPAFAGAEGPKVVFDCYYVNFAWGYKLSGVFIDSKGQVFKYNRNGNPWLPPSVREGASVHPESELLEKYMNAEIVGQVDKTVLNEKIKLIGAASEGTITRTPHAKDAGGRGCVAFSYDEKNKSYKETRLGSRGNFTTTNSAPEAQELYYWLQDYWALEKKGK